MRHDIMRGFGVWGLDPSCSPHRPSTPAAGMPLHVSMIPCLLRAPSGDCRGATSGPIIRRTALHVLRTKMLRFHTFPSVWVLTLTLAPREPRFPRSQSSSPPPPEKLMAGGYGGLRRTPDLGRGEGFIGYASPSIGYAR